MNTPESNEDRRWYTWITAAEKIAGHSLDGDQYEGDNYSLDAAATAFNAGISAEKYVQSFRQEQWK